MVGHYKKDVGEINKMVVKNIIKKIEETYNLNITSSYLVRESSDNKVYAVIAKDKRYVLRISKRDVHNNISFEATWLDYLSKQGIPTVRIIKTKNNKLFSLLNNSAIVLFDFAEGYSLEVKPNKKPNIKKAEKAAHELARIHNASCKQDMNIPRKRNIMTEINRALEIKDKFLKFSEGGEKFIKELEFYKRWAEKNSNNDYLIHNDFRPGNVFYKETKVSAILDFDWSCKGPAIKDVAHALAEWSFPDGAKKHWQDVFDAFLKGYNQITKNKIKLDNNLYRWICFSCLSDAATYFADLANENIYKKISSSYMYQKFLYFEKFIK